MVIPQQQQLQQEDENNNGVAAEEESLHRRRLRDQLRIAIATAANDVLLRAVSHAGSGEKDLLRLVILIRKTG